MPSQEKSEPSPPVDSPGESPSPASGSPPRSSSALPFPLALLCLALSCTALYFSQPGTGGAGLLAGVALLPFFAALHGRRTRGALGLGYLWGVGYFVLMLSWLRPFGLVAWLGLAFAEAMFPAFFAALAVTLLRRGGWASVWGLAALWVIFERIRMMTSFGFTWGDLSLAAVPYPALLHTASWWGAPGLSFFFALTNATIFLLVRRFFPISTSSKDVRIASSVPARSAVAFLLLSLLLGGWGQTRRRAQIAQAPPLTTVGLVQPNISRKLFSGVVEDPESLFRTQEAMTDDLARRGCRWVIWAESALPETLPRRFEKASQLARRDRIYLLVGGLEFAPPDHSYNSLFCFGPDGRLVGTYSKRRRVPFGEYVPFRRYLPSLERFGVPSSDLSIGHSEGMIQGGNVRVGANICFESFFSEPALSQRRFGAQFLAVSTNDSYYGTSPAAATHAAYLRLRAVETGLPAVQAAITGFSLAVLPDGRVTEQSRLFEKAALVARLPQPSPIPLWVLAPWLTWTALIGLVAASILARPRRVVLKTRSARGKAGLVAEGSDPSPSPGPSP